MRWWELAPAQDAISPAGGPDGWLLPCAARTPAGQMLVWLPGVAMVDGPSIIVDGPLARLALSGLEAGAVYDGTWINPRTGEDDSSFAFEAGADGAFTIERPIAFPGVPTFVGPTGEDWILLVSPRG